MSEVLHTSPADAAGQAGAAARARDDLGELLSAVSAVTARLEASHVQLQEQVARLTRDLGEAQAQLERSRRLAALGEMAAGIAHEIRNPLGCIRLYASMLEQDLSNVAPKQAGMSAKITSAAKVMEAIVSDVLTFSREFRLRPVPVDVRGLFERAVESCSHDGVPNWRGVRVEYGDIAPTLRTHADDGLVLQALANVVRNAYEAMAEAGHSRPVLSLSACDRLIAGANGKLTHHVVLSISDSGTGVPEEVVARMFNPFFTTRGAGTGLGLAIVHRIIDAHGGRVAVFNNSKARGAKGDEPGACIELILPATAAAVTLTLIGPISSIAPISPITSELNQSAEPFVRETAA